MKRCSRSACAAKGEPQEDSAFGLDEYTKDGLRTACRACEARETRARRLAKRSAKQISQAPQERQNPASAVSESTSPRKDNAPAEAEASPRWPSGHPPPPERIAPILPEEPKTDPGDFEITVSLPEDTRPISPSGDAPTRTPAPRPGPESRTPAPTPGHASRTPIPGLWRLLTLADVHHPEHHKGFWSAIVALVLDEQPDEIWLLGDFGEWASVSHHVPAHFRPAFEHDVAAVRKALVELRTAAPKARIRYCEGNHCTRLQRFLAESFPNLSLSIPEELGLADLGVEWVPEKQQPIRTGSVKGIHGHQLGKRLPKHRAMRLTELYGEAGVTLLMGHGHWPQEYVRPMDGGNCRARAMGCGRTLDPDWTLGVLGWELELALSYIQGGRDHTYFIQGHPVDGSFVWAGREYR